MKKSLLTFISFTSLLVHLSAAEVFTVDELIVKSLEKSPTLQISSANYKASKSRYDEAFSGYLPTVDLHLSAGRNGMRDTFGGTDDMLNDTVMLGKLSASQILYDFGKTSGNVDTAKYASSASNLQNIQDISDKKRDVKEAYYGVLNALALINVQKENLKLNEIQLYRAKKYFEAGIRTTIDVSDAQVSLIQAKRDLNRAEYDLKLAYASLDETVGFDSLNESYAVYSKELHLEKLFSSLLPYSLSLNDSIKYAYKSRAILQSQKENINASIAQKEQISGEYYPSLYATASYTKQKLDRLKNLMPEDQWNATLNLDWNLYNGSATSARDEEKKIQIAISQATLHEQKLRIKKEVTQAYINLYKSKDSVELSQSLLKVSSQKFTQASKRYEHGLSDFIELQQARQGYIDAKASLVIDYYGYYITMAYLDNAIGK